MTKRDEWMNLCNGLSHENFLQLITLLREEYNIALEDVKGAEWRVPFFTKALESCETGENFTFELPPTGKIITFDPDGEDKEHIAFMLEESKQELIKGQKLVMLLSIFKDVFENDDT
jgi:hypothetical protein